jgi:sialate O-acetylesterase
MASMSPETVGKFSGIGYFFAQKIYGEQNVPIGLINASWGGTNIETWISREAFMQSEEYYDMIVKMPNLNTTELEALKIKHIEEIQNLALQDFSAQNFINPTFDDTNCPSIVQPKNWEEQIIGNMDGIVWIRKTFELTADEAQQKAILKLSKIDDFDTTYINGVEVGSNPTMGYF